MATKHAWRRMAVVGFSSLIVALAGCGGGGGGGGGGASSTTSLQVALEPASLEISGTPARPGSGNYFDVKLSNVPGAGYYYRIGHSGNAIETTSYVGDSSPTIAMLYIGFKSAATLKEGSYDDTITIEICADADCRQPARGSPLTARVRYTMKSIHQPEPEVAALTPTLREALPHDVVDAEFSKALNAIVMVSTWPDNALYVYDAATRAERKIALSKAPRGVSVGPDGQRAAVGHDARVSVVDLGAGTVAKLLDLSADTSDLVLDGQGHVHVFAASSGSATVHSIDIASSSVTVNPGSYSRSRALLHPGGSSIYQMDLEISPSDIRNFDISSGSARLSWDSPYHGDYEMCGNFWFGADPGIVYTACGRSFRAPASRREDFSYAGTLALSTNSPNGGYRIESLSESAAKNELALIEYASFSCLVNDPATAPCYSHLNLYDGKTGKRKAIYSLQPLQFAGITYAQRGRFLFHSNGGELLLISQVIGNPDRATAFQISRMP
ncbi:YncE family protein [Roseateles violae]|uniref:Uncharacterized protein n=1 Tax=Roseateles violae TaxID=3058042 RepID=A0ABT8DL03_9BURK|nr:hypothetical protein [Pelomonas sp. PFR6]MDN3919092.1 hypothetical protein [Pelomonas sp. PFR6]